MADTENMDQTPQTSSSAAAAADNPTTFYNQGSAPSVTLAGVKFGFSTPHALAFQIFINFNVGAGVTENDVSVTSVNDSSGRLSVVIYTVALVPDTVISQDSLVYLWNTGASSNPARSQITASIAAVQPPANSDTLADVSGELLNGFAGSYNSQTQSFTPDLSVTYDAVDHENRDLLAGGHLTISDDDGIASVVSSTPQYGQFSINANGEWTYQLDPDSAAGLTAQGATDRITVMVTDNLGHQSSYNIDIDITVVDNLATAIALADDARTTLNRGTAYPNGVKVSDLLITDTDGGNAGTLRIAGADKDLFELRENAIWLKAGVDIDDTAGTTLSARVELVEDTAVGASFSLTIDETTFENRSSKPFIIIHGVKFTTTYQHIAGSNLEVVINFVTAQGITQPSVRYGATQPANDMVLLTYTITLPEDGIFTQQDLVDLPVPSMNRAIVNTMGTISAADLTGLGGMLTGGGYDANTGADLAVSLDQVNDTFDNFHAGGQLVINDADGIKSVTASQPVYGDFQWLADNEWVYTLDDTRPATLALDAGSYTDSITLTITDNQDNISTYDIVIAITVVDNQATDITIGDQPVTAITENMAYDTDLKVATLDVTDVDGGSFGRIRLRGDDANSFEIRNGNEVWLKSGITFDYETSQSVSVNAYIAENTDVNVDIPITITNVDEHIATFVNEQSKAFVIAHGIRFFYVVPGEIGAPLSVTFAIGTGSTISVDRNNVYDGATLVSEEFIVKLPADTLISQDDLLVLNTDTRKYFPYYIYAQVVEQKDPVDSSLLVGQGGQFVNGGFDSTVIVRTLPSGFHIYGADQTVTYDLIDPSKRDMHAGGTLVVTDADGVASITASAGQYGSFSILDDGFWTYELDPNNANTLALNADGATDTITVIVTDRSGGVVTHDIVITINVNDNPATALTLDDTSLVTTITEDDDNLGGLKIASFTVTDIDQGSPGTIEILGDHADKFHIVGSEVWLKAGEKFDYEDPTEREVSLRVQVQESPSIGFDLSLEILNINDDPNDHFGTYNIHQSVLDVNVIYFAVDETIRTYAPGDFTLDDARFQIVATPTANHFILQVKAGQSFDIASEPAVNVIATGASRDQIFSITLRDDVHAAFPTVDQSRIILTLRDGYFFKLDTTHLDVMNNGAAGEDIIYTLATLPVGAALYREGQLLTAGQHFTKADIDSGKVYLKINDEATLMDFTFTVRDGVYRNPEVYTFDIEVREQAVINSPEGQNTIDLANDNRTLVIDAGDHNDVITTGTGNYVINGGLGDDTITLGRDADGQNGVNTIIYEFDLNTISIASHGGDAILNFKRGVDKFVMQTVIGDVRLQTEEGFLTYLAGPDAASHVDDVITVAPIFAREEADDGTELYFVSGITIHFQEAFTYGAGRLANGFTTIMFEDRLTWDAFRGLIAIEGENGVSEVNFDFGRGIINDLTVLPSIFGANSFIYKALPPEPAEIIIPTIKVSGSSEGNDTLRASPSDELIEGKSGIDIITSGGGNDLIIGGLGNDTITLGQGAQTVIYRFESDLSSTKTSTAIDGGDTIYNFDLTQDRLILSDTNEVFSYNRLSHFLDNEEQVDVGFLTNNDDDVTSITLTWGQSNGVSQGRVLTINLVESSHISTTDRADWDGLTDNGDGFVSAAHLSQIFDGMIDVIPAADLPPELVFV